VRKRALENAVTGNAEGLDILHSEGIRCDDLHHRLRVASVELDEEEKYVAGN